jgi:hypothetical protein
VLYGSTATVIATTVTASAFVILWYVIPVVRRISRNRPGST